MSEQLKRIVEEVVWAARATFRTNPRRLYAYARQVVCEMALEQGLSFTDDELDAALGRAFRRQAILALPLARRLMRRVFGPDQIEFSPTGGQTRCG
ncbi:MAG: hypothetical protein AB7S38_40895 [Vulcanimicrobiota bacterium]